MRALLLRAALAVAFLPSTAGAQALPLTESEALARLAPNTPRVRALRAAVEIARAELLAELRRGFATLPGVNVSIGQPISHRIDHMLSGTRANIAVKVFGDDLGTLRRLGERVRDVMSGVPGVADLSLEQQMDVPVVRFLLNRSAIARYGLRVEDVAEAVEASFAGATVGRIFDRGAAFDLVVKFDPASSADFDRLADLPIDTPAGAPVPIRVLADVRREEGSNMILRENVQRRIVVSSNVAGRDLGSVVEDVRNAVSQEVPMPAGYRVEYGGQSESQQSASRRLLVLGAVVVAGLFGLATSTFLNMIVVPTMYLRYGRPPVINRALR